MYGWLAGWMGVDADGPVWAQLVQNGSLVCSRGGGPGGCEGRGERERERARAGAATVVTHAEIRDLGACAPLRPSSLLSVVGRATQPTHEGASLPLREPLPFVSLHLPMRTGTVCSAPRVAYLPSDVCSTCTYVLGSSKHVPVPYIPSICCTLLLSQ